MQKHFSRWFWILSLFVVSGLVSVLWDAHHLVSVVLGGQDQVLDLFRTKKVTANPNAEPNTPPSRESFAGTLLKVTFAKDDTSSAPDGGDLFLLSLELKLPPGSYTYPAIKGAIGATRIELKELVGLEAIGENFFADREPHAVFDETLGQTIEKFDNGGVIWQRRFRLSKEAQVRDAKLTGRVRFQVCNMSCTPHDESFEATLGAPTKVFRTAVGQLLASDPSPPSGRSGANTGAKLLPAIDTVPPPIANAEPAGRLVRKPFEMESASNGKNADPAHVRFQLSPDNAKPGDKVTLSITMQLEPGWHTFALDHDPANAGMPTKFELATNGLKPTTGSFVPEKEPELTYTDDAKPQLVHHDDVTWTQSFLVEYSEYGISGTMRYQVCRESCRPKKLVFALGYAPDPNGATVAVPPASGVAGTANTEPEPISLQPNPDESKKDATFAELLPKIEGPFEPMDERPSSLGVYLLYAFLGGLILNVMPCVLPVIAIKVLGFVLQSGGQRGRVLTLNLAYSAGVILVFLLLASLAVFAKLGWGNLYQRTGFQVAMSCLVFAMGLSLLGVFEIPVPGLFGSVVGDQHHEGPLGAFLTGIFATLLATPCGGPFLGVTLGWSVQQEPRITYLVWTVMGLGMASPYVLLGLFPNWVKYLPKPGQWMVTFKQICGFILMGTVIFLMSSMRTNWLLPTLIILLATGFSLWMIGNLYNINSSFARRMSVRVTSILVASVSSWLAVGLAGDKPGVHELKWEPFTGQRVQTELLAGRTVMIDFTAAWCATCQTVKKLALNTAETKSVVEDNMVVTLKADWTDESPEVSRWLSAIHSESIPVLMIFPGGDPRHPIVLRDVYTKSELLEKLSTAVDARKPATQDLSQR